MAGFSTDRDPQPGLTLSRIDNYKKVGGVIPFPLFPDSPVFTGATNTVALGEGLFTFHPEKLDLLLGRNRCRQTLAASGPPALDHIRTTLGAHTLTETVGALTAEFTRLIGTLGHYSTRSSNDRQ